jgi:hypothetical protein
MPFDPAVLGALLKQAVRSGGDDDPEELAAKLAREQLSYLLGTMIGLRELNAAVQGVFGYEGTAGSRFFSDAAKLSKQIGQGEADEALLRSLNSAAGTLFHYPATQLDKTVRGFLAWQEGEAGAQAVLFGPPLKQ